MEGVDETEEAQPKKKRKVANNVDDPVRACIGLIPPLKKYT